MWDPNSYANCDAVWTTHAHLELKVDFDKSSLIGSNTLNVTITKDNTQQILLDYQGIVIQQVEQCNGQGAFVPATYSSQEGRYGNILIINLLQGKPCCLRSLQLSTTRA